MARVNITAQEALQYLLGFTALGAASSLLGGGGNDSTVGANGDATSYPSGFFDPGVLYQPFAHYTPGLANNNRSLNRQIASKASVMQTLKQHNDAIRKFIKPGMNPAQKKAALKQGQIAEKELKEFWADNKPREAFTPSSSAIKHIRITPDNRIEVQWGEQKDPNLWYSYIQSPNRREASLKLRELITAPSIGRALVRNSNKGNNGWWAKNYFDPSRVSNNK